MGERGWEVRIYSPSTTTEALIAGTVECSGPRLLQRPCLLHLLPARHRHPVLARAVSADADDPVPRATYRRSTRLRRCLPAAKSLTATSKLPYPLPNTKISLTPIVSFFLHGLKPPLHPLYKSNSSRWSKSDPLYKVIGVE
jgi:hypothetical protein